MRDPLFAQTIATRSVDFPGYGGRPGFVLYNSSKLLARYPGALGGKTGYTVAARHTLVAAAEREGRRLVVALVRGEQTPQPMWRQAAALLDWGFAQPAGQPSLGQLVDAAPPPPAPVAAAAGTAAPAAAAPGTESTVMPFALGGVALAAILVGWVALRRRPRRR
jgi:D-alanyl-D-alanine carboxypeptidase (penicillin-binding protein 5/6)